MFRPVWAHQRYSVNWLSLNIVDVWRFVYIGQSWVPKIYEWWIWMFWWYGLIKSRALFVWWRPHIMLHWQTYLGITSSTEYCILVFLVFNFASGWGLYLQFYLTPSLWWPQDGPGWPLSDPGQCLGDPGRPLGDPWRPLGIFSFIYCHDLWCQIWPYPSSLQSGALNVLQVPNVGQIYLIHFLTCSEAATQHMIWCWPIKIMALH